MELRKADPAVQSFRVRYCSQKKFESRWRSAATGEALGLLTIQDKRIVFAGETYSGRDLHFVFEKDPSTIQFVGRRSWPNKEYPSRIRILDASKRQRYFTPETGTFSARQKDTMNSLSNKGVTPLSSPQEPHDTREPVVMERLVRLEDADREFDLEYWDRVGCEGRFEAIVAMLCDSLKLERNADPPRLQKSVERVEWR